ncbi:hypothetical protein KM043_004062 [Ampulex compressa]|nr:hypothetical protein KM043_004062 [Ampulex compressa]
MYKLPQLEREPATGLSALLIDLDRLSSAAPLRSAARRSRTGALGTHHRAVHPPPPIMDSPSGHREPSVPVARSSGVRGDLRTCQELRRELYPRGTPLGADQRSSSCLEILPWPSRAPQQGVIRLSRRQCDGYGKLLHYLPTSRYRRAAFFQIFALYCTSYGCRILLVDSRSWSQLESRSTRVGKVCRSRDTPALRLERERVMA